MKQAFVSLLLFYQKNIVMATEKFNPRVAVLLILMIAAAAMRIPNAAQATP